MIRLLRLCRLLRRWKRLLLNLRRRLLGGGDCFPSSVVPFTRKISGQPSES